MGDDTARILWGGRWRMPTQKDFEELIASCDWDWEYLNNVRCLRGDGINGNSIYFPMPYTTDGYWSSSLSSRNEQYALYLSANDVKIELLQEPRILLNYIRPVILR